MTRHACAVARNCRAFIIAVITLCAMLSTARLRSGYRSEYRQFRLHAKGAHREGRDDYHLPQSRRHSAQRRRQPRASFIPRRSIRTTVFCSPSKKLGPTAILVAFIPKCKARLWSRRERRRHSLPRDIRNRDPIVSFQWRLAESDNDYSQGALLGSFRIALFGSLKAALFVYVFFLSDTPFAGPWPKAMATLATLPLTTRPQAVAMSTLDEQERSLRSYTLAFRRP